MSVGSLTGGTSLLGAVPSRTLYRGVVLGELEHRTFS